MTVEVYPDSRVIFLVERLVVEFDRKVPGHCMRVDFLTAEQCRAACLALREQQLSDLDGFVLDHVATEDPVSITTDRAIELRNRKQSRVCLFVPPDLVDAAASSLQNSFSPFNVTKFLRELADRLASELPDSVRNLVSLVRSQLRGGARVPTEHEIDFCETVAADPTPLRVCRELWRVGLIPFDNLMEDFARRLPLNRQCVDILARPARSQATLPERIASLPIAPNTIQVEIQRLLDSARLQTPRAWLEKLGADETAMAKLGFDHWPFPEMQPSDLKDFTLEPFVDDNQRVQRWSKLEQPNGMGGELVGKVGEKGKVTIRWTTTPIKGRNR